MSYLFRLAKSDIHNKTIIMGYSPAHFSTLQTFFFSPIQILGKNQINYEVGTEEGVMLLLAKFLCKNPTSKLHNIFENMDIGYLSAETNVGEEEFLELERFIDGAPITIVLTHDFLFHPSIHNILAIFLEISLNHDITCLFQELPLNLCNCLPENNGIILRITQGVPSLRGSDQFAKFVGLSDGDYPTILHEDFCIQAPFYLDKNLRGTIGLLEFPFSFLKYPYQHVKIKR